MPGYIASTIPAKAVRVAGTTLFHVAMMETGDPLQWVAIAQLNGLTDPWIVGETDILIPPVLPTGVQDGILVPAATEATIIPGSVQLSSMLRPSAPPPDIIPPSIPTNLTGVPL